MPPSWTPFQQPPLLRPLCARPAGADTSEPPMRAGREGGDVLGGLLGRDRAPCTGGPGGLPQASPPPASAPTAPPAPQGSTMRRPSCSLLLGQAWRGDEQDRSGQTDRPLRLRESTERVITGTKCALTAREIRLRQASARRRQGWWGRWRWGAGSGL